MSKNMNRFANFESVENMNQTTRMQQFAYNGRMFIPPSTERFESGNNIGDDVNYQNARGRVQATSNESTKPYDLYKNSNQAQDTNVNIISNIIVPNAVSRTFFSNDNVERIQTTILNEVFKRTQTQISKQSYQELQIIMKSIYLQYSKNLNTDIEGQVVTLNQYVINTCVDIIIPNISMYQKYLKDITSPIPVMPNSQNSSIKGHNNGFDFSSLIPTTL